MASVLIIGSDHIGWSALWATLAAMPDVRVVGTTADLQQPAAIVVAENPHVIIADATLGGATPHFLADLRRENNLPAKIILFAARYGRSPLPDTVEGGVVGYLLWGDLTGHVLGHCLAALIGADIVLGRRAAMRDCLAAQSVGVPLAPAPSDNERAVLQLLPDGLTNRAIGARFGLSERSVERLVTALERKLAVPNKFALAVRATTLGPIR